MIVKEASNPMRKSKTKMISKKSSSKLTINRSPARQGSTILVNTSSADRNVESMTKGL
jgi:hypothetical protein